MDNGHFSVSRLDKLSQIVNLALRTLFSWTLFIVIDKIPVLVTIFELAGQPTCFRVFACSKMFKFVWTNAVANIGGRD